MASLRLPAFLPRELGTDESLGLYSLTKRNKKSAPRHKESVCKVCGQNYRKSPSLSRNFEGHGVSLRQKTFGRRNMFRLHQKQEDRRPCTPVTSLKEAGVDSATPLAVNARDLNLSFPGSRKNVLRDCSLQVPEGELWMVLGPNGCGKSTLLKVLAGLLRPSGGRMTVAAPRSFVFQNPDHQVVMPTAGADVAFGLGTRPRPAGEVRDAVAAALGAVGMGDYVRRPIQTLSGGQKQRVAIAGALAENSRLLLLDELTTFLDESDQLGVIEAVRKVIGTSRGVTALWVTHRLEELSFADGAVYMEDGKVVLSGKPSDVSAYISKLQRRVAA